MFRHIRSLPAVYAAGALVGAAIGAGALWHAAFAEPSFMPNGYYLDAVGPVHAQDVAYQLRKDNKLPVNGHDYLHEVGEYIYDHFGPAGAQYCRPYFDHACYNGLTIHMTSMDEVATTVAACAAIDYDTGLGCIHGGGHAALFVSDYNVPKALALCDALAAPYKDRSMLDSCAFGVFMELWEPHAVSPTATDTPWYTSPWRGVMCDDPRIAAAYRPGCWRQEAVVMSHMPDIAEKCMATDDASKPYCIRGMVDGLGGAPFTAEKAFDSCDAITGPWRLTCLTDFIARDYMNGFNPAVASDICARLDGDDKVQCDQARLAYLKRFGAR